MSQDEGSENFAATVLHLAIFFICVLLFEVFLIAIAPRLHSGSVLKIAKDSLLLRARTDSWSYMAQGYKAWQEHPSAIYESTFFERNVRFIYPPTSLLVYRGWQFAGHFGIQPFTAFKLTLFAAFILTWWVCCEFFFHIFPSAARATNRQQWMVRGLLAGLMCTFLPLINAIFLGQIQTVLNLLVIWAALLWLRNKEIQAGMLIGITCWMKPQMALFLLWGLLRRRWSFAVSLFVMLLGGCLCSLLVFGMHNTVEYLSVLQYLSWHGDALATNQSLNGLLHRQMHVGSPVTWVYGYPPYNATIYWATFISSVLLLGAALVLPVWERVKGGLVDFLLFAMAVTMASPIAWEHHYGAFFLVFLLWMPLAFKDRRLFWSMLAIYLLMTDNWAPVSLLMYSRWTFLISHIYFGGLLLFGWTLAYADRIQRRSSGSLQLERISIR